ncbi:MAG: hypothetical protein HY812_17615 [Planctomycetes bacterium]|nr:hypothetical protein [Planctomycetota bacterium]
MSDVIRGIESRGRFRLLKRLIAFGSLLPDWEKGYAQSTDPLSDDELASCVDFIEGHMVAKFQGKLAEILAVPMLMHGLAGDRRLPGLVGCEYVSGDRIRCRRPNDERVGAASGRASMAGPDGIIVRRGHRNLMRVLAVVEIKSMRVSVRRLLAQTDGHLAALARGFSVDSSMANSRGALLGPGGQASNPAGVFRILVVPSTWSLNRDFRLQRRGAATAIVPAQPVEPPVSADELTVTSDGLTVVRLRWSRDALRAAAFSLAHRYMREVGVALANHPEPGAMLRTDMSAGDAGMNEILHQLHVAIFRQMRMEDDPRRRARTIELYNVFAYGWAIGHGFRDRDGQLRPLFHEDIEDMVKSRKPGSQASPHPS